MPESILLTWKKYHNYKGVYNDDEGWHKGVYVMADKKGIPLYIGMASGKWGFADRYNATGFLDAAIESAGNLIYFARVDAKVFCHKIEKQLIWDEHKLNKMVDKYNRVKGKPINRLVIKHKGDLPLFAYLSKE